jgi:hypothetical protein
VLSAGDKLADGRYTITRILGEGSQATTYEAVDGKEGRLVAIKRFQVRGASSWKDVELAEREAKVLAGLSHPLIPAFVENFEEEGVLFLVTELVKGATLRELQLAGQVVGMDEVLRMLLDLGQIVEYLHSLHPPVIHRDIKPGNILRREDGRYVLVDFGAVRAKLELSQGSTVVGTFGFMAPEQFQGRAMPQSDVYAIGATVLSLMTGLEPEKLPHRGLDLDVAGCLGPRADPRLVDLLARMVVADPDRRLGTITPSLGMFRRLSTGPAPAQSREAPRRSRGSREDREAARRAEKVARKEEKRARKSAREIAEQELKAARRDLKAAGREWRTRYEGRYAPRPFGPRGDELAPPPAIAGPLLAIAKVVIALGAMVIAPLVLSLLSIAFGSKLRRAAKRSQEAGQRLIERLEGEERVWAPPPQVPPPTSERRVEPRPLRVDGRVEDPVRDDAAAQEAAEQEAREAAERDRRARADTERG